MAEKLFNVGDVVALNKDPSLIGEIIKLPGNGTDRGLALVQVDEGKTLIVALPHWHKARKAISDITRCDDQNKK